MHYGEQILREPSSLTSFGKYKVRGIDVLFEDYIKEHPQHSPVRTQYLQIKRQNPDAILFFRMGDFYEMFDDDAEIVAREVEIALTRGGFGRGERLPLAGIPHHAADGHNGRLGRKGGRLGGGGQ